MKKVVLFAVASIFTASVFASPSISNTAGKVHPQEAAKSTKVKQEPVKPVKEKKPKANLSKAKKGKVKKAEAPVKKVAEAK